MASARRQIDERSVGRRIIGFADILRNRGAHAEISLRGGISVQCDGVRFRKQTEQGFLYDVGRGNARIADAVIEYLVRTDFRFSRFPE